jgi:hypothetical protein
LLLGAEVDGQRGFACPGAKPISGEFGSWGIFAMTGYDSIRSVYGCHFLL